MTTGKEKKKTQNNVREQYEADNDVGHQCLLEISGLLPVQTRMWPTPMAVCRIQYC